MTDKKETIVQLKPKDKPEKETPFQRFLRETESKLRKEEKHTWMVKDHDHLHQNE